VRVALLGPLAVTDADGRPVPVVGARLRALLARLALEQGRPVAAPTLISALWEPGEGPADALNALQTLVSRLRRATGPDAIESTGAGYRLVFDGGELDSARFEALVAQGRDVLRAGDAGQAGRILAEALAGWRGPALADVLEAPFAGPVAARLERLRDEADADRVDAALAAGRAADVVPELESRVAGHPLDERAWAQLLRALHASGRTAQALTAYEQARRHLADELGADPSAPLQEAHLAVLRGDPVSPKPRREPDGPRTAVQPSAAVPTEPAAAPQHNLRAPLTSFVGRGPELERVTGLLATGRLVTLVGPGGSGKTRLASEVGHQLAPRFRDGVRLVELAPLSDAGEIPQALLGALSQREVTVLEASQSSAADALSRLVDALAGRQLLLLVDNCEHLVEGAARVVDHLLTRCPELHVLATSREALAVDGEALCPVPPLARPAEGSDPEQATASPSVRLFLDRAAAVRPGFALTQASVGPVVEICRRLDGLPLAIELAAARLRTLPVEVVADRLGDRFRLLAGGSRTAVARHQTLRAVVAWSWDLLADDERALVECLGVFAGGAGIEAAAAVSAIGPSALLDLLSALVDKSLLYLDDRQAGGPGVEPRFRMLETLREYALERLADQGVVDAVRRHHADHFIAFAETADPWLRTSDQVQWIDRLTADRDNLHAALRFCIDTADADGAVRLGAALSWFWTLSGSHTEASTWLRSVLAVPGKAPENALAVARLAFTMNSTVTGDPHQAAGVIAALQEWVQQLAPGDAHPLLALIEPGLAMVSDDGDGARRAFEKYRDHADPWTRSALHLFAAVSAENEGDIPRMRDVATRALAGFQQLGERWGTASSLALLAGLRCMAGDFAGAASAYTEAAKLLQELRAVDDVTFLRGRLVVPLLLSGDLPGARAVAERAVELARQNGSATATAMALMAEAAIARHLGEAGRAREKAAAALDLVEGSGTTPPQAAVVGLVFLAQLDLTDGLRDGLADGLTDGPRDGLVGSAWARLVRAHGLAVGVRDMPVVAMVCVGVACVAGVRGDDEAAELLGAADAIRGTSDAADTDGRRLAEELTQRLGEKGFRSAWDRGCSLSRRDALALLDGYVRRR